MDDLFLAIFLLSILCLFFGMINPRAVIRWGDKEQRTRKKVLMFYGVLMIMSFVLFGLSTDPVELENDAIIDEEQSTESQPQDAEKSKESDAQATEKSVSDSKMEYVDSCREYDYENINRNPEKYEGAAAKFTGKVIQVQESWNSRFLRVEIDGQGNVIYVSFRDRDEGESRILEDDFIVVYGELTGIETYIALLGNKISVPSISAKYIDVVDINQIEGSQGDIEEAINNFSIYDLTGVDVASIELETDSGQIIQPDIYSGAIELPIEIFDEEINKIIVFASEKYSESTMRDYEIERQTSAFEFMSAEPKSFVKTAGFDKYNKGSKTDWVLVKYDYENEMEAFEYISNKPESTIKQYVIEENTKGNKINWTMVEYEYDREMVAYEYISNEPESTIKYYAIKENTRRGNIDWTMTEHEYEDEMEAFEYISNEPESRVKMFSILEHWEGVNTDWSQVSYEYERQMKAYEFLKNVEGIESIILDNTNGSGYTDWARVEYEYTNQ
jgi:hypothetical protein